MKPKKWKNIFWLLGHLILIRMCRMDKIDISGGEPTIYPRIKFFTDFCRWIGFKEIRLVTNGTNLSIAHDLARNNDRIRFSVSVHSHVPADLKALTGKDITFKLGMFLKHLHTSINYVNTVITPYNTRLGDLAQGVKLLSNSDVICFKHLDYNFDHDVDGFPMSKYRADINSSIRKILLTDRSVEINLRFFPFCFLDPDLIEHARVKCCSAITNTYDKNDWLPVIGRKTPLKRWLKFIFGTTAIRHREAVEQAKFQGKWECAQTRKCFKCKYYEQCDGVQKGYLKRFGDDEFKPVTP
jgi:hypothetical protein